MSQRSVWYTLIVIACNALLSAQTFTRITDPSNPVVTGQGGGANVYPGAAWVDYDNDGDIDLFACPDRLFRNNGGGAFQEVFGHGIGIGLLHVPANGVAFADMDNDGYIDCLYSGAASVVYRNNGPDSGFTFSPLTRGEIASVNNRGWAGTWGDFDNDGFVDPLITHPRGFVGTAIRNPFFRNLGGGEFDRITTGDVEKDLAPYTVATWSDFDQDGDQDLFIGSGPAGTPARDYLFRNMLKETGSASLVRINDGVLGTDLQDGQVWNWIDYDNDGDLDGYVTNYGGVPNNNLYRNDAGTYVRMTPGQVGPIVSSNNNSLSNIWVDFDNDGDLDCFVTRDSVRTCLYYTNNGDGTFARNDTLPMVKEKARHIAAVAGDYDGDGDMDLFIISGGGANELYRNDQPAGNHWLIVTVKGSTLNRTAIGAKVRVKATVNGKSSWQIREVSAQNSFNGHNSHDLHFGLGNAAVADSIVIEWPSGERKVLIAVPANQHISALGVIPVSYLRASFFADIVSDQVPFTVRFTDRSVGLPSGPANWAWDLNGDGITDSVSRHPSFTFTVPETSSVRLIVSNGTQTDTLVRKRYITAIPAFPIISMNTTQHYFGGIDVNEAEKETTITVRNLGKGSDSLLVSLVYGVTSAGTVKPDSAAMVTPSVILLGPKDSAGITFRFYPRRVVRTNPNITYTPKIVVNSRFNSGAKVFEKNMFFKLTGTLTGAEDVPYTPEAFSLSQNYPNPFNPVTTFRFTVPEDALTGTGERQVRTVLQVFNILGSLVATITDAMFTPGVHAVQWDASAVPSGVYLYRLSTPGFTDTKKLILMK